MNKILAVAILIGLTGTASIAAPSPKVNLEALPKELQTKIKNAQENATKTADPVTKFVDDAGKYEAAYKKEVENVLKEYPYLNNNANVKLLLQILDNNYTNIDNSIKALKKTEPNAQSLQASLATAEVSYNGILDQTFPTGCKTYNGDKIQGWIMPVLNSKQGIYALYKAQYNNQEKPIAMLLRKADGTYDVGQIGTGKEFVPSIANNSQVMAQLGDDGKGNKVVVCLDLIKTPPSKEEKPSKPGLGKK